MKLLAFGLRAEYQGDTTVERDGAEETVPVFQGGVLAVGGTADFHVADTLRENDGTIVVYQSDRELIDVLEAYPALKSVPVPERAVPLSPFERRNAETLRHLASLRDFERLGDGAHRLALRLEAHDVALADQPELAPRIAAGDDAAVAELLSSTIAARAARDTTVPSTGDPELLPADSLETDQLVAVLDNDTATFADAGRVEVPAAIDELRSRATREDDPDERAFEALHARDLISEQQEG